MARRRRKKTGGGSALFIVGGTVLSLLSMAVIGGYFYLRSTASTVELDKASLCPKTGAETVTVVLLDVTDPISDITAVDLRNEFQQLVASVPPRGLIQVYSLTDQEGQLILNFSGCNPGDSSTVDEWTNNPRMAQQRWEEGFETPLRAISGNLSEGQAGKQSPIMAGIQRINVEVFGLPSYQSIPKTLVVASDMIEHTSLFSMYRNGPDFAAYEQSDARQKFRSPLAGVSLRILEFQRPGLNFSDEDIAAFWGQWVSSNMGNLVSFKRLQGI